MGAVLVTGGSRGLGRAIVEALAAEPPARVAFTWNADEAAARAVEEATGARAFRFDLHDRDRPDELVAEGFCVEVALTAAVGEQQVRWTERRWLVRSQAYAQAQEAALERRLASGDP